MVEAYNQRLLDSHELMRHHAFILSLPNLKKGTNKNDFDRDFWMLPGERRREISGDLKERYNRLKNGNKRT